MEEEDVIVDVQRLEKARHSAKLKPYLSHIKLQKIKHFKIVTHGSLRYRPMPKLPRWRSQMIQMNQQMKRR